MSRNSSLNVFETIDYSASVAAFDGVSFRDRRRG